MRDHLPSSRFQIELNTPYDIAYWALFFHANLEEIEVAIKAVGSNPQAVGEYFAAPRGGSVVPSGWRPDRD